MLSWQEILVRVLMAFVCGAIIGVNRDLHHKPAGFRTFGLVSIGSALAVLAAIQSAGIGNSSDAVTRVIQGVLTGIGFLGAGVILHRANANRVAGLTTAAAIWLAAAIGVAAATGQFALTLIALGFSLFTLIVGGPVERYFERVFHRDGDNGPSSPPAPGPK